jgi:hypothetical protein
MLNILLWPGARLAEDTSEAEAVVVVSEQGQ